ncbi:MAG: ABC transporter ATP-binding protein [Sphingosinicella sp.]
MTALLEARGLSLPGRLQPTSIDIQAGELACVVGPNGSGKTSLLHAIARIGQPAGEVCVEGADLDTAGPAQRMKLIAFLPASRDIAWPLTGIDLVRLGGADQAGIEKMIVTLELAGFAGRRVDRLSTGERSRILLARAMAPAPALLLLDEPTANLDPFWQIALMEALRRELQRAQRSALVAMHDLDAAARFADRLLVMAGGAIVADGNPETIITGPDIPRVFAIERDKGRWQPLRQAADRQSSP